MKQVQKPCIGCVYFDACGETTRTMPCDGRMTASERKRSERYEQERDYKKISQIERRRSKRRVHEEKWN
jgi:hypothetical protein